MQPSALAGHPELTVHTGSAPGRDTHWGAAAETRARWRPGVARAPCPGPRLAWLALCPAERGPQQAACLVPPAPRPRRPCPRRRRANGAGRRAGGAERGPRGSGPRTSASAAGTAASWCCATAGPAPRPTTWPAWAWASGPSVGPCPEPHLLQSSGAVLGWPDGCACVRLGPGREAVWAGV